MEKRTNKLVRILGIPVLATGMALTSCSIDVRDRKSEEIGAAVAESFGKSLNEVDFFTGFYTGSAPDRFVKNGYDVEVWKRDRTYLMYFVDRKRDLGYLIKGGENGNIIKHETRVIVNNNRTELPQEFRGQVRELFYEIIEDYMENEN